MSHIYLKFLQGVIGSSHDNNTQQFTKLENLHLQATRYGANQTIMLKISGSTTKGLQIATHSLATQLLKCDYKVHHKL